MAEKGPNPGSFQYLAQPYATLRPARPHDPQPEGLDPFDWVGQGGRKRKENVFTLELYVLKTPSYILPFFTCTSHLDPCVKKGGEREES